MDTLLLSFVAAALAGWGDRTQMLLAQLSARHGRPGAALGGAALAGLAISMVGAVGGALLHGEITQRAITLLLAVGLAFAGVVGLITPPPPGRAVRFKGGAFLAALIFAFAFASGGRTQFLTFGLAARAETPLLAFAGASAGMIAAAAPAALLGEAFLALPLRLVRIAIALLFLMAAAAVALSAL